MPKMTSVPGHAFDIGSMWISDPGRFEFTSKADPHIVRFGPTLSEAEAFATLLRQCIEEYKKRKS